MPCASAARGPKPEGGRTTPSTSTWPLVGFSYPARIFISVDLPAPFSPSRPYTRPGCSARLTPCNTCTVPNALTTSRNSTATLMAHLLIASDFPASPARRPPPERHHRPAARTVFPGAGWKAPASGGTRSGAPMPETPPPPLWRPLDGGAHRRGGRRHRLHTALVAAVTARAGLVHTNMPHIARRAIGAAVHLPVAHNAAANAGAHLDDQKIRQLALQAPELAQRHQVHIVIDKHRRHERLAQIVTDGKAVPVRHQRRVDQLAAGKVHRAGHTHADGNQLRGGQAAARHQFPHQAA